jgi:outer membrane receptor protein involved in Fe transport
MSFWTPRTSRVSEHARRAAALVTFLLPGLALAQTGALTGTVVDGDFGGGLPGASVLVVEQGTGAATDIDGNYRIDRLPVGTYTVRYSFTGYATQVVENVEIAAGEPVEINVTLSPGQELAEVVVEAEEIIATNSEVGLLRVRARAAQVSDAISAETISQSGASDAGDAMERVTGASVQGGRYVYVRGLGDRYANTQLNGATLPTADPDRRSVQFDLFPAGLLENIVTLKTFTADQPGNFSGGLIDISTKSFPEAFSLSLSASGSVDTQTQFTDEFLTYEGGGTDWLGVDDGTRALPDAVADPERVIPNFRDTRRDAALAAELDEISRAFVRPIDVEQGTAPVNQSYSLSLGNQRALGGGDLGFILGFNYGRSASYYGDGTTARYSVSSTGADGSVTLTPDLIVDDSRGTTDVTWGGIANVAYRFGGTNELSLNTLYTRGGESQARLQVGRLPEIFDEPDDLFINRSIFYVERELASGQLRGRHLVPFLNDAEFSWTGSLSQTALDEPDLRFFGNTRSGETPEAYRFATRIADVQLQQRFFRETSESLRGLQGDLAVPFQLFGRRSQLKVGGRYDRTDRDADERRFSIETNNRQPVLLEPGDDGLGDADGYVGQLGIIGTDNRGEPLFGNYITEVRNQFTLGNAYEGYLDVVGTYAQVEVAPLERLRVILGARYETTRQGLTTLDLDEEATAEAGEDVYVGGRIAKDDILPSLNVVYALSDQMNLRAAATQTLARPTFLEFSPGCRQSFALAELVCGNASLDRSLISNADLRWEWFTGPAEVLAVSGYAKRIDNPIELAIINTNGQLVYRNVDQANIYGVEFEARQRLGTLAGRTGGLLDRFSIGFNASLVSSYISIDEAELEQRRALDPTAPDTRALQGQSPYIINADLAYDDPVRGTNVGAYFNVFGRRLSQVSALSLPDVYEQSSPQLDLVASQQVLGDFSLKLSVKNVLGSDFSQVYDADLDGGEAVYQRYGRGTSVSLGLSFNPRFGGGTPPSIPTPTPADAGL